MVSLFGSRFGFLRRAWLSFWTSCCASLNHIFQNKVKTEWNLSNCIAFSVSSFYKKWTFRTLQTFFKRNPKLQHKPDFRDSSFFIISGKASCTISILEILIFNMSAHEEIIFPWMLSFFFYSKSNSANSRMSPINLSRRECFFLFLLAPCESY